LGLYYWLYYSGLVESSIREVNLEQHDKLRFEFEHIITTIRVSVEIYVHIYSPTIKFRTLGFFSGRSSILLLLEKKKVYSNTCVKALLWSLVFGNWQWLHVAMNSCFIYCVILHILVIMNYTTIGKTCHKCSFTCENSGDKDAKGMASNHFSNYEGIYNIVHQPALVIAGCSVLVALVLSLFLIFQHLRSYTNPSVRCFSHSYVVFYFFCLPVIWCEL